MIYLDHLASTSLDPRVREAMLPWLEAANPASVHGPGRAAAAAIEEARASVAALIEAQPDEIVFTSGATEANHLALLGFARGAGRALVIRSTRIEHKAVLEPLHQLEREGHRVELVRPSSSGVVEGLRTDGADLVSMMLVNNELGTIQPVEQLSGAAALHVDAAQGIGCGFLSTRAIPVDLVSLSAHKMYGPQGVGALFVRAGRERALAPLQRGGGQERGLRAGTPSVAAIVGFGAAARLAVVEDQSALAELRDRLRDQLRDALAAEDNGDAARRTPGALHMFIPDVDGARLVEALADRVAIATGSACTSAQLEPSHVLRAIGLGNDRARASVRLSVGRETSAHDVDAAAALIIAAARGLRA